MLLLLMMIMMLMMMMIMIKLITRTWATSDFILTRSLDRIHSRRYGSRAVNACSPCKLMEIADFTERQYCEILN